MKAIIYDVNMNYLETIDGTFEAGSIKYTQGGIDLPLIGNVLGTKLEIKCDYKLTYKKGKVREANFKFDGKDYRQLSLGDVPEDYHFSANDYLKSRKIAHYAKDDVLTKPIGINQILEGIATFIMVILIVVGIVAINSELGHFDQSTAPFSKVANSTVLESHISANTSAYCIKVLNATLTEQNNLLAKEG